MDDEEDGFEPEILTYEEFRKRETLNAWRQRRRAYEQQTGRVWETAGPPWKNWSAGQPVNTPSRQV